MVVLPDLVVLLLQFPLDVGLPAELLLLSQLGYLSGELADLLALLVRLVLHYLQEILHLRLGLLDGDDVLLQFSIFLLGEYVLLFIFLQLLLLFA